MNVLVLGGTGRTGRLVVGQLLDRGVAVRAIVRSAARLPEGVAGRPGFTAIEADVLSMSGADLRRAVDGCDAVVSCLGHSISFAGVFGPPYDLVTRAVGRVYDTVTAIAPAAPVRFVLMSSVSVNRPGHLDTRRGAAERAFLWVLRGVLPPARDNQRAADFLIGQVGTGDAHLRWVAVRPDSLTEGGATGYGIHEGLVDSLFAPGKTNMANVAHFMSELVTDPKTWDEWAGRLPVVVNV